MINTKKVLLFITIIFIVSTAIVSSVYFGLRSKEKVKGVSIRVTSCTPYIVNVMPNVAYVGREYYFIPRIIDCGSDSYNLTVNGAPWLRVNRDGYVYGVPSISDLGDYKVELNVETELGSANLVEYVIVKEYEE